MLLGGIISYLSTTSPIVRQTGIKRITKSIR